MEQFSNYTVEGTQLGSKNIAKSFMSNVFSWMFVALAVSTAFAFAFSSNETLLSYLIGERGLTGLGKITMFAPLIFVLVMSFGFARLSAPVLTLLFSFILLVYTQGSVITCFAAAASMFGIMAVMGYTTKQDLTSFGRILSMGLIGIVIASLINMFMGNPTIDYIISIVGVAVFTGLTAYDVQKLKNISAGIGAEGISENDVKKLSIFGALTLYLDFINLFLMLLRLFGSKRD
jgi:FtsH-binding integral membrane protein